jgi:hypothetical protein
VMDFDDFFGRQLIDFITNSAIEDTVEGMAKRSPQETECRVVGPVVLSMYHGHAAKTLFGGVELQVRSTTFKCMYFGE